MPGETHNRPIPGSNVEDSLNLLQMGLSIDHEAFRVGTEEAREILTSESLTPRFLAGGGVYTAALPTYSDGDSAVFRFTIDGKLMTDASITVGALTVNVNPTVWTKRYYIEADVTAGDSTVNFGFTAAEIIIVNDDNTSPVWFNYGAAAVADASHDKVLAGDSFSDNFASSDIHLITNVAGPIKVRVWARAL